MKSQTRERGQRRFVSRTAALWISIVMVAGVIFVADSITNLEIAVAVLYVVVILLSVRTGRPRAVMMVAGGCAVLTVASFLLSRGGAVGPGVANSALSLLAIGATTVLALRIEAAGTAAREAQADLAHLSRVMIVSELATSVAHEVSQPLAAIVANSGAAVRWLSRSPEGDAEVRLALERIVEDAARAGAVIDRVRSLVKRAPRAAEQVDLGALVLDSLVLLRREIQDNRVLLRTELSDELPSVRGDRVQLQQVILNLIINGIEAMSDTPGTGRDLVVATTADRQSVEVTVQDAGAGVAQGAIDHVFEPFYSTKPNGMGVGLSISRSIIESHGGTVFIRPGAPKGGLFGFALPLAPKGG